MKRILFALFLFPTMLFAEAIPGRFVQALQRALDADALWTMTKTFPQLKRPIVSSGGVSCWKEKGIIWYTLEPFEEEIKLLKTSMIFSSEGEIEEKSYADMPYYEEIREATDNFLQGKTDDFEKLFRWTWQEDNVTGAWVMQLDVRMRQLHRLFKSIELKGNETLECVTFVSDDEKMGTMTLMFKEESRSTHLLWTTEAEKK